MNITKTLSVFMLAAALTIPVMAQDPSTQAVTHASGPHPKLLDSFLERQMGMGAEEERLMREKSKIQSQIEIKKLQGELEKMRGNTVSNQLPTIIATSVFGSRSKAVLLLENGNRITVLNGDRIEGVGQVESISRDGQVSVRVTKGRGTEVVRLKPEKPSNPSATYDSINIAPLLRTQ